MRTLVEFLEGRTLLATKVMPLGDSITEAETGHASYRYWLWQTIQSNGFTNVDFVGSRTGVLNGPPQFPNFDQNHEGHWGWRADQILANIGGWANTYRPDVVLMHLGTNDIFQGQSVSSTINELGSIIDTIRQHSPNVTVLLAQVIPATSNGSQLQQLNSQIPGLASQKNTAQSRVIAVDQWTGYSASADNYDGVHPNQSGEQKMRNKWYSALSPFLTPPPEPPAGTYLSDLNPTSATNGWGPYERDRSNGEAGANDGGIITLNGTQYPKGLGTHAASELRYSLGAGYDNFLAEVGVDDEVGNSGSVVFQVRDQGGALLYDSGTMTGATATKSINLNVTGKTEIRLIVTNGGNNNDSDHADWALARLTRNPVQGPVVNAFNGATINEGGTYTASGSFSDSSGATNWTGTVNYGDGTGNLPLTLNPDKTFALSHVYADNANYTVTVTINNGTANGVRTATVNVNNVAPSLSLGPDSFVNFGQPFTQNAAFADPGTSDTWTATVDYGDGSGPQPLALGPGKTFTLNKTYAAGGNYTVVVAVRDKDNATGTSSKHVNVIGGPVQLTTHLSDMSAMGQTNGWGPFERDRSNGEAGANDGSPIRITGVEYSKGLGVHANSELRYNLNRQYARFKAMVGVDDETGGAGSVRFQVFGDGALLFDSNVMRGREAGKSVDVSVANVTELRLLVSNGGDNVFDDHADWADARVTKNPPQFAVNELAGATVNEGSALNAVGSFSDPDAGPWSATVDYGDGSGEQPLALNPDKSFALNHVYVENGNFTVTVAVNNGSSTVTGAATVQVNNVGPAVSAGANGTSGVSFSRAGSFADPGISDTWTATVDYGDGAGVRALSLNPDKTFTLNNTYVYNGTYTVRVTVVDDDGAAGVANFNISVSGGASPPVRYLSDMSTVFATNGWGAYERDRSNGEAGATDGNALRIAGISYSKGLGVHASSDLRYDLTGGGFDRFQAAAGVDDEENGAGSVRFQVYLDGVLAYDSGTVRGGQSARLVDIDVRGKSQLRLVVTDNGDNNWSDHADWADARLTTL
jgi:hypothetical protein